MLPGRTGFAELMSHVSARSFRTCVDRYHGDDQTSRSSCWEQFLCLAFAQLTGRESLRDIEICLRAMRPRLYHRGLRARVARTTLADANERRDWRIFADVAHGLVQIARELHADEALAVDLTDTVYALDATLIDLCLSVYPWAHDTSREAAVKVRTVLDLRGAIPSVVQIAPGNCPDVAFLDDLPLEAGAIYIMDRGYIDVTRLCRFRTAAAFFITRTKRHLCFTRHLSRPTDASTGVRSDHLAVPTHADSRGFYPERLRRVRDTDPTTHTTLSYLTNNFVLPAVTIAQPYTARWQVELFFTWIKQHLRMKAFYGTIANAVKAQIWTAIAVCVLVAIVKKRLDLDGSRHELLQVLSLTLFEKMPISTAVFDMGSQFEDMGAGNQLQLLDL